MRLRVIVESAVVLCALTGTRTASSRERELSFEDRVEAQRAIEQVYWNHRIWPEANPDPKPSLAAVMPDPMLRRRVEDYLRKSNALAEGWGRRITAAQLQAEMERMVRETKSPDVLNELFAALGDDPALIAETLVRQKLVERLLRDAFAYDARFHGEVRHEADRALAGVKSVAGRKASGAQYQETTWRRLSAADEGESRGKDRRPIVRLGAEEWEELLRGIAHTPDAPLEEREDAFVATSILSAGADEVTTATLTWPKTSFDSWWAVERNKHGTTLLEEAGTYALVRPLKAVGSVGDTWRLTFDPQTPEPHYRHTAVWTGTEMIVWGGFLGGYLNMGARYDPATNTWLPTSTEGDVPPARWEHTAVWTGTEMIVWGGNAGPTWWNDGGRYDPSLDMWLPLREFGTNARSGHTAVWTGTEMIIWGGRAANGTLLNTGARYAAETGYWTETSMETGVPAARFGHTAVWTGTEMIVWGGNLNTGGRYDPSTNTWAATSTGPSARSGHTAVWTGTEMIVWGGNGNTGSRYRPSSDTWLTTSTGKDAPAGRSGHTAVWTGTEMIVWGGRSGTTLLTKGGRYDPVTNTWAATAVDGNTPSGRVFHTAVWTGREMIVWGGQDATGDILNTGGRYDPVSDTWVPTTKDYHVPTPRFDHTAVWTGTEMIVWGGLFSNSGGRYDPATDTWVPTSRGAGVPTRPSGHTAIWTGTQMIVWGGNSNTGGRYDPMTDTWAPTSLVGAPQSRSWHSAVWTGKEMIVWGGFGRTSGFNTGGRYDPWSDTWVPTSTAAGVPDGREFHTAVWTGKEMIVWGGNSNGYLQRTGGRYDPATDTWAPTSLGGAPTVRMEHTAVWTGNEMIIWGGYVFNFGDNSGGRYDPSTDTWRPTSSGPYAPWSRQGHTAVWTGTEMIVWGGLELSAPQDSGNRYDPLTDGWAAISTVGAPRGRYGHTAVWTGTSMIVWGGYPWTSVGGVYVSGTLSERLPPFAVTRR